MKISKTMLIASAAALFSTAALAATTASLKDAPDASQVTLSGTVENFDSAHSFTLRDASGTASIDLSKAPSVILKNGESVDVSGIVNKGMMGTTITAQNVSENKAIGQKVGEAIDSVTGNDADSNARQVTVKTIPASGLIKVNGTVDSIDNAKKFTLKDSTGNVDVNIKSSESASLTKGAHVTVIGYPDKGMLGTTINATKVELQSD